MLGALSALYERGQHEKAACGFQMNQPTGCQLLPVPMERMKPKSFERAFDHFLCLNGDSVDENPLLKRLNSIEDQLNRVERNLKIVNEVAALHVRYHLTATPSLPQSLQRAACRLGFARFEVLVEQVRRRVAQNQPLLQETSGQLCPPECESSRR
jgi:hypothetical protein